MKLNIKTLSLIFGGLILVFLLSRSFDKKDLATFDKEALKIDTTKIDLIKLYPKAENHEEIILSKKGNNWFVQKNGLNVEASEMAISRMLSLMQNLKLKRVAALEKEAWKKYEVTDSLGTRVALLSNNKIVADWWIGKFSFSPNTRSATSFVRKNGEDEVFAVNDLLSFSFNQPFDQWRNSEIVKGDPKQWKKLEYQSSDGKSYFIEKQDSVWQFNGVNLDSAKIEDYFGHLANLTSNEFVDNFNVTSNYDYKLIVNSGKPGNFEIKCWEDTVNKRYVVNSSLNKTNFFGFDKQRWGSEVFINTDSLLNTTVN